MSRGFSLICTLFIIIGQLAPFLHSTLEKLVLAAHQLGREPDQAAS